MRNSDCFWQKHRPKCCSGSFAPHQRSVLNDLVAGYGAGQKIIASVAADSNDPNLQQLLAQTQKQRLAGRERSDEASEIQSDIGNLELAFFSH